MHIPVLKKEVLEYLSPKPNENFIDCTIGESGHTSLILEKNKPGGKVLGIEWDSEIYEVVKSETGKFSKRLVLVNDSYSNLSQIVEKTNFKPVSGILLDLGYSSWQLEQSKRGFSFKNNEILDMRYNIHPVKFSEAEISQDAKLFNRVKNVLTAEKIVNEYSENEIEKILKEYGQEKFARQIANKIIEERKTKKIQSTFQLKEIIEKIIPKKFQHGRIHCATKSFQAIRIAVNDELNNLTKVLPQALSVLSKGGRLVILSFHSLEDRIVKNFFKNKLREKTIKILTKKPITPSLNEILVNPRSRSAKLRAVIKN